MSNKTTKYIVEIRGNRDNTLLEAYRFDDNQEAESFAQLVDVDSNHETIFLTSEDY